LAKTGIEAEIISNWGGGFPLHQISKCSPLVGEFLHAGGKRRRKKDKREERRKTEQNEIPAEIGDSPSDVSQSWNCGVVINNLHKKWKGKMPEHNVSIVRRVTSNVSQCPNALVSNVFVGRVQQVHEQWHGTQIHHKTSVVCCSRSNVRLFVPLFGKEKKRKKKKLMRKKKKEAFSLCLTNAQAASNCKSGSSVKVRN
jgi:hypothetical protein